MQVLGYLKKKHNWNVTLTAEGEISTGGHSVYGKHGDEVQFTQVPIFIATLKYRTYTKYQSSVTAYFDAKELDEAASFAALLGKEPKSYTASVKNTMLILQELGKGSFTIHGDGWFTGTFTLTKQGSTVSITPFLGDLAKELPVETENENQVQIEEPEAT